MSFVNPTNYQNDPEKVNVVVDSIYKRTLDAKKLVEELLYLLDMQEKVPWPDMLEKFSALASAMSTFQISLRKSAMQSGIEDHGSFLRSHVMVPQRLQYEQDPLLQEKTENRVGSWNHDLVPDYLRTKPLPEMERDEELLDTERVQKSYETIVRQIGSFNKNIDILLQNVHNFDRAQTEHGLEKPTSNTDETIRVVRAIMSGDGLMSQRPMVQTVIPPAPSGMMSTQGMNQMGQMGVGMMPQRPPMSMLPQMNITR